MNVISHYFLLSLPLSLFLSFFPTDSGPRTQWMREARALSQMHGLCVWWDCSAWKDACLSPSGKLLPIVATWGYWAGSARYSYFSREVELAIWEESRLTFYKVSGRRVLWLYKSFFNESFLQGTHFFILIYWRLRTD